MPNDARFTPGCIGGGLSKREMARRQEASAVPRKRTPERGAAVEDRLREGGEPGTDRGPVPAAGRSDGGQGVDLPVCAG